MSRPLLSSRLNFYPRPPRGGRQVNVKAVKDLDSISIHALREEGDGRINVGARPDAYFYPRPPRGGRLETPYTPLTKDLHFYPRPPRGGRRPHRTGPAQGNEFLSTPSARRATQPPTILRLDGSFLSTPSARRATRLPTNGFAGQKNFYPRPPRGGRRGLTAAYRSLSKFLSTPSARRATISRASFSQISTYFYPRPPRGGRQSSGGAWADRG